MSSLNLLVFIIELSTLILAQLQQSKDLQNCIPTEIVFVCLQLNSITDLSYTTSHRIYASSSLSYLDPFTSRISTQTINSKTTVSTTVNDIGLLICVPTLQTEIDSIIQYAVIFKNRDDSDKIIGRITIDDLSNNQHFNLTSIKPNQSPLDITISDNAYFTSNTITSSVTMSVSIWISNMQCIQIKEGYMFAKDDYMLSLELYRSSIDNSVLFSSQATMNNFGTAHWNEAYICLPNKPVSSDHFISANVNLYSTTQLSGISSNNIEYTNTYEQCQYRNGTDTIISFDIGNIDILYIPTCEYHSIVCPDTDKHNLTFDIGSLNVDNLDIGMFIFVICTLCIGGLLLIIASYTSKHTWKSSDPVKFDHIIFFVVFLWTSLSQLTFIIYLNSSRQTHSTENILNNVFYVCLILFIVSYIANITALTHYLQIWNHALAPGVTRHWLQYWSWFLIMICVLFGNVNIALELCNCLIFPTIDVFAMHLPRSETVNARLLRFWTNSLCLDLPFFVIICIFLGSVNTDMVSVNRFLIWNTLIVSFLSFLCTVVFAVMRRKYSNKNPIALYKYAFTFKPIKNELFESYFIHSHFRIKQSFAELIQLRKTSLVIIDQCSEVFSAMKVEGRILKDIKVKGWDDSQWRALQNIKGNSEKLKRLLAIQFGLLEQEVTVENFQFVRMREIDGQLVYDYDTAVKRFFECQKCHSFAIKDSQQQ